MLPVKDLPKVPQSYEESSELSQRQTMCQALATGRKLSAVWGVHCVVAEDAQDQDDMVNRAGRIAFRDGFVRAGQRVIIVAGVPLGTPGTTNMVRIASVGPEGDADM